MADNRNNVLLPMQLPTTKTLRSAIAAIFRDLQRDFHETDQDTADRLGISIGTVRNARNELCDLSSLTIAKIGASYGARYTDPYLALYGAHSAPAHPDSTDPLSHLAESVALICRMRTGDSDGGGHETPKERLDALPQLRKAHQALTAYIAGIERLRAAA